MRPRRVLLWLLTLLFFGVALDHLLGLLLVALLHLLPPLLIPMLLGGLLMFFLLLLFQLQVFLVLPVNEFLLLLLVLDIGAGVALSRWHLMGHQVAGVGRSGVAAGAGIGAAVGSSNSFWRGKGTSTGALVGVAIFAPSGALVGAMLPDNTTVYRAAPGAAAR